MKAPNVRHLLAGVCALSLVACASRLPPPTLSQVETADWRALTRAYRCDDGARLSVTYLTTRQGDALAVVAIGGQQAVMRQLPAASGARYADLDEQRGLRWHTRGDEGFLAVLAPDHTATEQMKHTGCVALPAP